MSKFETRFDADDDADRIRAAFYDIVERHADDDEVDGDTHISTEISPQGRRLRVRLWSAAAMDAFLVIVASTVGSTQRPCFE